MNHSLRRDNPADIGDLYEMLLVEYATGVLDSTLSLLMASHLTLSAAARRHVAAYERLGGALIAECCEPVAMASDCLKAVMARLDECAGDEPCAPGKAAHDFGCGLPQPLQQYMTDHACHEKKWRRVRRSVSVMNVPLPGKTARRAMLVQAGPGAPLPRHRLSAREYALVLQGALRDYQHGAYQTGDLLVIETSTSQRPVADAAEGCVCLVIADGPDAAPGWLGGLFPFRW
jgi:putative transcriptional regulator